jgi:small subunit ribosomal protein S15
MARIHKHRKGRSGSTKPFRTETPEWQPLSSKEVETQVVGLAKEGKSSALIGAYMRDQFGVPDVQLATKKGVLKILRENKVEPRLPEEITNLLRDVVNLQGHLAENKKDLANKRALSLIEAKIRRLAKYFIREGRLPADWTYSSQTAKLLLE